MSTTKRWVWGTVLVLVWGALFLFGSAAADKPSSAQQVPDTSCVTVFSGATAGTYLWQDAHGESVSLPDAHALAQRLSAVRGGTVDFREVTVPGDFSLAQICARLHGTLSVAGGVLCLEEGAQVCLLGHFVFSSGGYLRVADASFTLDGGHIGVQKDSPYAIAMDRAPDAVCTVRAGTVRGGSCCAVRVRAGTLLVTGGTLQSEGDCAVDTDVGMILGGAPILSGASCGVRTRQAIRLAGTQAPYTGNLHLRMDVHFLPGTWTPCVYRACAADSARITLTDMTGNEATLTYLAQSPDGAQRNLLAVTLPYTVTFRVGEQTVLTRFAYAGETSVAPGAPEREGYHFLGWYAQGEQTPFAFGGQIDSDLTLCAAYGLCAPSFSLGSLAFSYDGQTRFLSLRSVSHPLEAEGQFDFAWYKEDVLLCRSESVPIRFVSDSGSYYCKITFTYKGDSSVVCTPSVSVSVTKMLVSTPEIPSVFYTGAHQSAPLAHTDLYTVESCGGVHAGEYTVGVCLRDTDNTAWAESQQARLSLPFIILPAPNEFVSALTVQDCYEGKPPQCDATARFGDVRFLFCAAPAGAYSAHIPLGAGTYYVRASVEETADYAGILSDPVTFRVLPERAVSLRVCTAPSRLSYTAFESMNLSGAHLVCVMASGDTCPVAVDQVTVSYPCAADSLRVGDTYVTLSYQGVCTTVGVTVSAALYDLSALSWEDLCVPYDGVFHTPRLCGQIPPGMDGTTPSYTVHGGGTDAGTYTVRAVFLVEGSQYVCPAPWSTTFCISARETPVIWENTTLVYTGDTLVPVAHYLDVSGTRRPLTVSGGAVRAGDAYIATAHGTDSNYRLCGETCTFSIARATFDLSGVRWSDTRFLYDGGRHAVTLSGLPKGLYISGYADADATEAGVYEAQVRFAYDRENYEEPYLPAHRYEIIPAVYDLGDVAFPDTEYVYDGEAHTPRMEGTLPAGADGTVVQVVYEGSATHVREGRVDVTVRFISTSRNYLAPAPRYTTVRIVPLCVPVSVGEVDFVYDGTEHLPLVQCDVCSLTVRGGRTDAGTGEAYVVCDNSDYVPERTRITFTVAKAPNRLCEPLGVSALYETHLPTPAGRALYGTLEFSYYADEACTETLTFPAPAGFYYMRAQVAEGKNYHALVCDPVRIEVMARRAQGIRAQLEGTLTAYRPPRDGEIRVFLLYNDATQEELDASRFSVRFGERAYPLCCDRTLSVHSESFYCTLAVTVCRARLDRQALTWSQEDFSFDGEEHVLTLQGLPAGVRVREYRGNVLRAAGTYTVQAILEADANYEEVPASLTRVFTVHKACVRIPPVADAVYTGRRTLASVPLSPLFRVIENAGGIHAGEYDARLALSDPDNYEWENTEGENVTVSFHIMPISLTVQLSDADVYYDGFGAPVMYTVTEGDVLAADDLGFCAYEQDGLILASFRNPDYEVTVLPGHATYYNRFSVAATRRMLLLIFISLSVFFVLLCLLFSHRRIAFILRRRRARRPMPAAPVCAGTPSPFGMTHDPDMPVPDEMCSPAQAQSDMEDIPLQGDAATPDDPFGTPDSFDSDECNDPTFPRIPDDPEAFEPIHTETPVQVPEQPCEKIDPVRADALITDALAQALINLERRVVISAGERKSVVNVDTLSDTFCPGELVDVNRMKGKRLLPPDTGYVKVLARGTIDKPLTVLADDFSLRAVKMIALTGGEAIRAQTLPPPQGMSGETSAEK